MTNKKHFLGIICALTANIIFGFSFIFSKSALEVSHPLIILAVRFTVAFLFLNILWALGLFKINTKSFKNPLLWAMGLAQPFLYFILELYGLSLVSSALSGVIISLVPVAVMLLSTLVLKEKPTRVQWFFTFISILGVCIISIISNDGQKNYSKGIFLLAGAVICAGVFNVLSRKQSGTHSPFERTYVMFLIGCIGFNLTAVTALKSEYFPIFIKSITNFEFIISIIYLAIISSVVAFLLYNFATANITAVQAASFSNIITVVTILAGIIIRKEYLSAWSYPICAIIILGVWGVNRFAKATKK